MRVDGPWLPVLQDVSADPRADPGPITVGPDQPKLEPAPTEPRVLEEGIAERVDRVEATICAKMS